MSKEIGYYFPFDMVKLFQPSLFFGGIKTDGFNILSYIKQGGERIKTKQVITCIINTHCCYERQEEKFHIEASKNFFTHFNDDLYKKVVETKKDLNLL